LEFEEVAQMFASVMTTKGHASKEEYKRVIDQLLPRGQSLPGFKGVLFLLDEKSGKGMTINLYESEEVAQASAEARDRLRKEGASQVGASISNVEGYEVVVASGIAEPIKA
jgi:heme-degrading monooxygenase HmoA